MSKSIGKQGATQAADQPRPSASVGVASAASNK